MDRRPKKLPEFLTKEERGYLLEQPNRRYPTGERNYVILELFLDVGLRLSELTNLKWKHVDLMEGHIMVREGKGAKDRSLWAPPLVLEFLREWRKKQIDIIGAESEFVFSVLFGSTIGDKLCIRYVQKMVKRYAKKARIKKDISPHTLRHTFATNLLKKQSTRVVQITLGHSNLSSTQIYTHVTDEEIKEAMRDQ